MSRSYKNVKLKKDRVYSVEQLKTAYSVSANTVSNWVGEGLKTSDRHKPHLFRGAEVNEFHRRQRSLVQHKLAPGQFKCWGCQSNVFPEIATIEDSLTSNGRHMYSGRCPNCSKVVKKISAETDRDAIEDCLNPNTPTESLHECNPVVRGDIWTNSPRDECRIHTENDRILHRWQIYAGRYSDKTVVRHLGAIRYFEAFLQGKPFHMLTTNDFAAFRDDLKRRANVTVTDSLSASSIRHTVSHLVAFFDWLLLQDGYRRLPKDFSGYLKLPKAVVAKSAQVKQKEFPDLLEAERLLISMPSKSLVDQRSRAIFALAFLGALRADTLASLQLKHLNVGRRLIQQDASVVRAKAGKSLTVLWFRIPMTFEKALIDWIETLSQLGFVGDDALFPDAKYLSHRHLSIKQGRRFVPVMATTHAVTAAFALACKNSEIKYTPHSAKHTIGAERDIRALTREERKAWSLNMGHESETITELHYGTMSDDRRFDVLESIKGNRTFDVSTMSEADKAKVFDALLKVLSGNVL